MVCTHRYKHPSLPIINPGSWRPCCAATPEVLVSEPAFVTTTSTLMSSALPSAGRGKERVRDGENELRERRWEKKRGVASSDTHSRIAE